MLPQLALDAGYFKDEGLDVTIQLITGGQETLGAMNSGEIDMGNLDSPSIISGHVSGLPVQMVAVPVTKPIFDFMVGPDIKQPSDLTGKTVGVGQLCDSTCFQVQKAMVAWGMKAEDVSLLQLRDYPGMYAALTLNQIAGAPLAPPFNFQAQQKGYHSLADLSQLPIEYPTAVVISTQKFLNDHPDTVTAFLRAYTRAIDRYRTDEAFTVQVYQRFLNSDDVPLIQRTWTYYAHLLQVDPTPTATGVQTVLDSLAAQGNQRVIGAKADEFIAPRFMEQLKSAGFLQVH